jgi:hypothetical protein
MSELRAQQLEPDLEQQREQRRDDGPAREGPEFARAAFEATEPDAQLRAAWQAPELSRATIAADPWTSVYLPIPERPNPWLLLKAHDAARECEEMIGRGVGPQLQQGDDGPDDSRLRAAARTAELSERLEVVVEQGRMPWPNIPDEQDRKAWQAPEFSRETIEADLWTAVYLPIPEKADVQLLAYARSWVSDLRHAAEIGVQSNSLYFGPALENMHYSREEKLEAATERLGELERRLDLARANEVRLADILGEGPLRAVNEAIPREADAETLEQLRGSVEQAVDRLNNLWWHPGIPSAYIDAKFEKATQRMSELDARILGIADLPEIEGSRAHGEFLSGWFIAYRLGDRAARAVEMVLDTIFSFFVPEPDLTPQQARDLARADAERAEARAFESARRENASALYEINAQIKRDHASLRGVIDDPETIYDRYPGLTREDSGDDARTREEERAFYDTGMERSR